MGQMQTEQTVAIIEAVRDKSNALIEISTGVSIIIVASLILALISKQLGGRNVRKR